MPTVSNRNGTLDVLKFCFALMILIHHARQLIPELKLFQGYYIGVYFFFMVSGIFMAKCAIRDSDLGKNALGFDTLHYMKRRIIALFPCYAVAFLFCFIVSEIVGPTSINHIIRDAKASVFSLIPLEMAGFSSNISIGGSWFISAMLIAQYLLYPLARHSSTSFFVFLLLSPQFFCLAISLKTI